jgi:hypothetical protein
VHPELVSDDKTAGRAEKSSGKAELDIKGLPDR